MARQQPQGRRLRLFTLSAKVGRHGRFPTVVHTDVHPLTRIVRLFFKLLLQAPLSSQRKALQHRLNDDAGVKSKQSQPLSLPVTPPPLPTQVPGLRVEDAVTLWRRGAGSAEVLRQFCSIMGPDDADAIAISDALGALGAYKRSFQRSSAPQLTVAIQFLKLL